MKLLDGGRLRSPAAQDLEHADIAQPDELAEAAVAQPLTAQLLEKIITPSSITAQPSDHTTELALSREPRAHASASVGRRIGRTADRSSPGTGRSRYAAGSMRLSCGRPPAWYRTSTNRRPIFSIAPERHRP